MKKALFMCVAVLGALLISGRVSAQGIGNVRINEVLVVNEDNYMDDYGHRSSWIELFNSGHEMVDVSSCHIGVKRADGSETRYLIPDGDPATAMSSQTYLVFFCEGAETKGTFYTNFTLDDVVKIALYSAGGGEVNSFELDPAASVADVSVGWMSPDGIAPSQIMSLPRTTPNATNETLVSVPKHELFRRQDPWGGVMAITAMLVVFSALVLIFLVFKAFGMIMMSLQARRERRSAEEIAAIAASKRKPAGEQVQEELAAVAVALKLYQEEIHINESTVITINRASRVYSPWSSKIHGITPIPKR